MNILAWLVVGAVAGGLVGFVIRGGELGTVGHVIVGIVGALIAGLAVAAWLRINDPIQGLLDIPTAVLAGVGAAAAVVLVRLLGALGLDEPEPDV